VNLGEVNAELDLIVQDLSLSANFTRWVNNAILEIANDFDLPALRLNEPVTIATTESDWLYDMPTSYMKKLFKCRDEDWNRVTVERDLDDIDSIDIDHNATGSNVTNVATRDLIIGIYPRAVDTLKAWYYKQPTALVDNDDEPLCIPNQYHYRVLVPKIVIINFELIQDMAVNPPHKSLEYWHRKYHAGLYGDTSDMGMINCLARDKKPRRTGGSDPLP